MCLLPHRKKKRLLVVVSRTYTCGLKIKSASRPLSGSDAIAGGFSKAYLETFKLTYVSGRTVESGALLSRLCTHYIQRLGQPNIFIGFSALNKLLGRDVYNSHMQLGGTKVMAVNCIIHLTVADELEGVSTILKWLSFVAFHV